jgi:hypothetical protein
MEYRLFLKKQSNTIHVSIGENCLTDNILKRYELKDFSTPFSHARTNIDYLIDLERNNYSGLLDKNNLYYDFVNGTETKVVRNKKYNISDNIYNELHTNGFEFTHHDIINEIEHFESYTRKISRLQKIDNSKKIKFYYHYRNSINKNLDLIIEKAKLFLAFYERKKIKCEIIIFTQEIIKNKFERKLILINNNERVKVFIFKTLKEWAGDDPNLLWARIDEDLIKKMIRKTR